MPELPYEIWKDRIDNELNDVKNLKEIEKSSITMGINSVDLVLTLNAMGFIKDKINLQPINSHRIYLKINRSFPYPGGIDFSWLSNIFHPNIHPVELSFSDTTGTGYICLNVLKKWSRLSDLVTAIKALKMLVENPNPKNPLDYPECLEAAKYFKKNKIEDLKKKYLSKGLHKNSEKKEDDDIIILD